MKTTTAHSLNILAFLLCLIDQTAVSQTITSEAKSDMEFNRTTSCVRGGLPKEIQFVTPNYPPTLDGETLSIEGITLVADSLDSSIRRLLLESGRSAWEISARKDKLWSPAFFSEMETALAGEIVARAPKQLNIEFCGDSQSVGNAAFAAIAMYVGRSVALSDAGEPPQWLRNAPPAAREQKTSIVMIAVSLHLAGIPFDPSALITGPRADH